MTLDLKSSFLRGFYQFFVNFVAVKVPCHYIPLNNMASLFVIKL